MRWPMLLLFTGALTAIPTVHACTEPPPIPLADFAYISWDNDTVTTVWNGHETHWHIPTNKLEEGKAVFEPGQCQPGPGRPSVSDPADHWVLAYNDEWRCCSSWFYGPLQLRNEEVHHEWSKDAHWIAFEGGVAIRDGGVDWVAFGPPEVRSYGAPQGEWGRLDDDTAYFVHRNVTLLDVHTGHQEHHGFPASMHGTAQALPAANGRIVVVVGGQAAWFNGSFSQPVAATGQLYPIHGGLLADRNHEVRLVDTAGNEAHHSGASVENVGHGPAASAVAVRSNGTAQIWILDGVRIIQRVDLPGASAPHKSPVDPSSTSGNGSGQTTPSILWAAPILLAAARYRR